MHVKDLARTTVGVHKGEETMAFRFAIMGAGNIAGKFVDAVRRIENCEVAAVASKSKERAENFARQFQIERYYDSYETMLQDGSIDCVYIATTPNFHFELCQLCLAYNIPILCEKAMFRSRREAEIIFSESRRKGIFVMEAMWSRFLPALEKAKQWLDEGRIGEVSFVNCIISYAFDPVKNHRNFDPLLGGGAAFDLTVYAYELTDYFWGREDVRFSVNAGWDHSGIDLWNQVNLGYGENNRKMASLYSGCTAMADERIEIAGSMGRIVVPYPHHGDRAYLFDIMQNQKEEFIDEQTKNGFIYEIEEAVRCIRKGNIESEIVPHELTLRCSELFDVIYAQQPCTSKEVTNKN